MRIFCVVLIIIRLLGFLAENNLQRSRAAAITAATTDTLRKNSVRLVAECVRWTLVFNADCAALVAVAAKAADCSGEAEALAFSFGIYTDSCGER